MTLTREEAQALYDQLGTQLAVADHIGKSTAGIGAYLRSLGVVIRARGRVPGGAKKVKMKRAARPAPPPIRIRECRAEHLKLNPYFTQFPVPCIKYDMMHGACDACRERYQPQVVRSGSSMGGVVELRSGSV